MRLSALVEAPDGTYARWGPDDRDARRAFSGLTFSSTMPGGFENCSLQLPRRPDHSYVDLEEFATVQLQLPGGRVVWEGRLESSPRQSGFQHSVNPGCVGWQAQLEDNKSVRVLIIDIDFNNWGAATATRKQALLNSNADVEDPQTITDPLTGAPALRTLMTGSWNRVRRGLATYDAKGLAISALYYAWKTSGILNSTDTNFLWQAQIIADDTAVSAHDNTANLRSAGPGTGTLTATGIPRTWAEVWVGYAVAGAPTVGQEGAEYGIDWTSLAVVGNHGCPLYTTTATGYGQAANTPMVLASDVVAYALRKWCPKIGFRMGNSMGGDTIQASTFLIPHLVQPDAGTAGDLIKAATRFELLDWAVWEGPLFYLNAYNGRGRKWRARVGPANLSETGPQVDKLWNGVIVQFTDVTGVNRTVGPVGSGSNTETSLLSDPDPLNPANQAGFPRWTAVQMATGTPDSATKVGQAFLAWQKLVNNAGKAELTGYVVDENGILEPVSVMRAGDQVSFVDANDTSYRRIVRADYDHDSRKTSVDLDAPPDGMQQLLERLGVVLTGSGFS